MLELKHHKLEKLGMVSPVNNNLKPTSSTNVRKIYKINETHDTCVAQIKKIKNCGQRGGDSWLWVCY